MLQTGYLKNNLIVNAKNSNVIIISHSPIIKSASLNITLDGNKLDQVPYVKQETFLKKGDAGTS